jgi:hypothetical protein
MNTKSKQGKGALGAPRTSREKEWPRTTLLQKYGFFATFIMTMMTIKSRCRQKTQVGND